MKSTNHFHERGGVSGSLIAIITLIVLTVAASSLAVWAYANYTEQKTDVDGKIALAVAKAQKTQGDEDEKKFAEREKEPNNIFAGPDDYGRLTFSYPKTWSVYVASDTTNGGTYQAYLNPGVVPPVGSDTQQFAVRVTIEQNTPDEVLSQYQDLVQNGDLKSSATSSHGHNGTRLDGKFSDDIRGAAVIYKIRDKTVTVQTDANTFLPDFNKLVKTIDFNS